MAVTAIILVPASIYLIRLTRPGGERRSSVALVALPFIAVVLLAVLSLTFAPSYHGHWTILGNAWLECIISIPLIAIVPFSILVWIVRQMAPTDLARTGAFVGLVAGCVSAIGYAVHCADELGAILCAVVWRDDRLVHVCWLETRAEAAALVNRLGAMPASIDALSFTAPLSVAARKSALRV